MELIFLGTGGSWPTPQRNVSAFAIKRGSELLLFDCGEGTQRQFQRSNVSYMAISNIFLTHLHGDHILGLPGLLQTMNLNDREAPLTIHGPPGTKRYVSLIFTNPLPRPGFEVNVKEITDEHVTPFDGYRIVARQLDHTVTSFGYALIEDPRPGRFDKAKALDLGVPEGPLFGKLQKGQPVELDDGTTIDPQQVLGSPRRGRKIAYTGDCRPSEATVELAHNADVLIHEATFSDEHEDANRYGHSTASQAAFIAKKAHARTLYLTHISPRYANASPLEEEARTVFENAHIANDLDTLVVKFPPDEPATGDFAKTAQDAATAQ